MTVKRVSVMFLVTMLAAIVAAGGGLVLVGKEAEATLATVTTCAGGTIELNSNEKYMLERHNETRKKHGLKALCVHPTLTRAARAHSQDMLNKDYASHYSLNGDSVKSRLERFGYTFDGYSYYAMGENIAWGCGSYGPERVFSFWKNSKVHRHNILNKKFREVGIGVRTGTFKTCGQAMMYTVDFATRRR